MDVTLNFSVNFSVNCAVNFAVNVFLTTDVIFAVDREACLGSGTPS